MGMKDQLCIIHSFSKYQLSTAYVTGTLLSPQDITVNKTEFLPSQTHILVAETEEDTHTMDEGVVSAIEKKIYLEKQLRATRQRVFPYTTEIQPVFKGTIIFPHPLSFNLNHNLKTQHDK